MKPTILNLVFTLIISIFLFSCASDEDGIYSDSDVSFHDISLNYTSMEFEIINLINKHRDSVGLTTLKTLNLISKEAIAHTTYMISEGEPSHDNFSLRHQKLVVSVSAKKVGENVAYGYHTAKAVVRAWIKSDGHRRNIENNEYTDFGISTKQDTEGRNYFTQIFIKR
jgi:uncharacterized protein YkwD